MKKLIIYAHRGASAYAPENTGAAFLEAVEMQAGGIETDVHLSKDGEVVVCHDGKVDRTSNGSGLIEDMTLEELKSLDFGTWFDKKYADEKILTLEELLELLGSWNGILNIELKQSTPILHDELEKRTVDILHRFNRIDSTIISSFNHYSLMTIKKLEPALKIGLLYSAGLVDPWKYAEQVGAEAIHPLFSSIPPSAIQGCIENGIIVNTWTVNQPEQIRNLAKAGVDGIITNVPDVAIQVTSQLL